MGNKEGSLIEKIRLRLQDQFGTKVRTFRQQSALLKQGGRHIRVGKKGMADLYGYVIFHRIPCFFCIEAKTRGVSASKAQLDTQGALEDQGVAYFFVREEHFDGDMDFVFRRLHHYEELIVRAPLHP